MYDMYIQCDNQPEIHNSDVVYDTSNYLANKILIRNVGIACPQTVSLPKGLACARLADRALFRTPPNWLIWID